MGDPALDIKVQQLAFVCDEPSCELARGSFGLTADEIRARVVALQAPGTPAPPEPDDPDSDESDDDESDDDESEPTEADGADPGDPAAIDPLGEGAPCPLCHAAVPPRAGKLLAVVTFGEYARTLGATTGPFGLLFWQLISSNSRTGTNRVIDAQRHVLGDPTKSKATTAFVVGRKAITAVVLKELPFDGHLLRYGNQDAEIFPCTVKETIKGKWKTKKVCAKVEVKYGIEQGPPGAAAREHPAYVRELQEDLFWLGYFSPSRGTPTAGQFDVYTLGAVLGFKQDLIEIYGITTSTTALSVTPGSVRAGEFTTAIWSQAAFVSPVRIILDWRKSLRGRKKQKGLDTLLQALTTGVDVRLAKAKKAKDFRAQLVALEKHRVAIDGLVTGWPHLAALERVTESFLPFAPKPASKTVDQLAAAPANKQPKHASGKALADDPVWSSKEYNAREKNRKYFLADLANTLGAIDEGLDDIAVTRQRMGELAPPAEVLDEWNAAQPPLTAILARLEKLLDLVRFWILDAPTQMQPWLAHIEDMGTVDQPTAVYLKALREGGKIGPSKRPAYQLKALTAEDDFTSADDGAKHLRKACTDRPPNKPGKPCTTMPEIIALQFFGNESGMTFTRRLKPFNNREDDAAVRLVHMGIDTNAHRKGSFDAVFHAGGDWYSSRGWGVGQATEANGKLDGVQLRRGLPIMPAGADAIQHPGSYVDREASVADAMERKMFAKYNGRTEKRDCTFGKTQQGDYYDCHSCLKRFHDEKLIGKGEYGNGGVFVPIRKGALGSPNKATGFFVDLERHTLFARSNGDEENPAAVTDYQDYFDIEVPAADAGVAAVLRRIVGQITIVGAAKTVAKEQGLDAKTLVAGVQAHVAARVQLPCSWLLVRIQYAGSGEQAFGSLMDLLKVVGNLDTKNATLIKNIEEASLLRRES